MTIVVLGAATGMRSMAAPSQLSRHLAVALCEDVAAIALARGALTRPRPADAEPDASRRPRG